MNLNCTIFFLLMNYLSQNVKASIPIKPRSTMHPGEVKVGTVNSSKGTHVVKISSVFLFLTSFHLEVKTQAP